MGILVKSDSTEAANSFALIGYENILASTANSDQDAMLIPNTWERWEVPAGTQNAVLNTSGTESANFVAVGAHNLGSRGATLEVEILSGSYSTVAKVTPADNTPLFIVFDEADITGVRLTVTGGTSREIGVVYAGTYLKMERGIFGGHSPVGLSRKTDYRNATSDTGQFLGRRVRRKGLMGTFAFQNLTDTWYRENFEPFVVSAITKPFFIAWRPDLYPDEVAFGMTTKDISPSNQSGAKRLMSVSFDMRAHDE
jgi:hypothetical protein